MEIHTETDVLVKKVIPFLSEVLGFDIVNDVNYEISIFREVEGSNYKNLRGRIDVLCYKDDNPFLIVEVKPPNVSLFSRYFDGGISRTHDNSQTQLLGYINDLNVPYGMIINGKQIIFYDDEFELWKCFEMENIEPKEIKQLIREGGLDG